MNKNRTCPPPFVDKVEEICSPPIPIEECPIKPPPIKEVICETIHPPKPETPECGCVKPEVKQEVKFVDAEDITPEDKDYTIPVKKDPETGLLFAPEIEGKVVDKELNEESDNPIENATVARVTREINERVDGISKRLAALPDAFTYDSLRHFLSSVHIESDEDTNSTYITKIVRSTGVEVNANELVIGTMVFIKGVGPDYWLVTKTINSIFADTADINLVKLEFFDKAGEDNITNVTSAEIDETIII